MKKIKVEKLKLPLWYNMLFYTLTVLAPVVVLLVQGFRSHSVVFKITFTGVAILLAFWLFAKKFLLSKLEEKMIAEKAALEHDYMIENGSKVKCKWLWYCNEMKLSLFNLIQTILLGGLIIILCIGIQTAAVSIKGAVSIITICYLLAYAIKFTAIIVQRGKDLEDEQNQE